MASSSKAKLVDDFITFLSDPMFEIPIKSFMDENCLLFDPCIEIESCHHEIFHEYSKLIRSLIEGFCRDVNVTYTEAMNGLNHLISTRDMREVFYDMTEPIHAASDMNIFVNLMTRHNILIQEQVLQMMLSATGSLPDSLVKGGVSSKSNKHTESSPVKQRETKEQDGELVKHMKDDEVRNAAQQNVEMLKRERTKLEEDMKKLVLDSKSVVKAEVQPDNKSSPIKTTKTPAKQDVKLSKSAPVENMTSSQAAESWMRSAREESESSASSNNLIKGSGRGEGATAAQIAERERFMREQRDKLLAIKRQEREKQLIDLEKTRPQRPQSALAARRALDERETRGPSNISEDEVKKLAARRALAEKLKAEVVNK